MQSSKTEIDQAKAEGAKKAWDDNADMYANTLALNTLPSNVMLYSVSRSNQAQCICEVGIGPGEGSLVYISNYMKAGAQFYNSDISSNMIKHFEKKFEDSPLGESSKIQLTVIDETDSINVPYSEDLDEKTKHVYATVANNEQLPYPDEVFDCYLANLSLMLVSNPDNMLAEAYRVTQKGATLGFTIVGRPENQGIWTTMSSAVESIGCEPIVSPVALNKLDSIDSCRARIEQHGFVNCKLYYAPMNNTMSSKETFDFAISQGPYKKLYQELDEEKKQKLEETFNSIYDEKFGVNSISPTTVEIIVALCQKPSE